MSVRSSFLTKCKTVLIPQVSFQHPETNENESRFSHFINDVLGLDNIFVHSQEIHVNNKPILHLYKPPFFSFIGQITRFVLGKDYFIFLQIYTTVSKYT